MQSGRPSKENGMMRAARVDSDGLFCTCSGSSMCAPLPIDIVYTWVNGSDPKLLADLAELKLKLEVSVSVRSREGERMCVSVCMCNLHSWRVFGVVLRMCFTFVDGVPLFHHILLLD